MNLTQIIQYGVIGVVLLLVLTGHIVPGYLHTRTVQEKEALQAKLDHLYQVIEERVIPALVRSTDAIGRVDSRSDSNIRPTPSRNDWGDTFR